jgi:hypothetical protein
MGPRRALWVPVAAAAAIALTACVPVPAGRVTPTSGPAAGSADPGAIETPASTPEVGGPTASPSFSRPTPNPSPTFLVYEVRAGDTLTSVARLFGTTARSIAFWNRERYPSLDPDSTDYDPNRIEVGWTLHVIPTEVVDEDELPDPTPTPTPGASAAPAASASPT